MVSGASQPGELYLCSWSLRGRGHWVCIMPQKYNSNGYNLRQKQQNGDRQGCLGNKLLSSLCWAQLGEFPQDQWTHGMGKGGPLEEQHPGRMPGAGRGGDVTQESGGPRHVQGREAAPAPREQEAEAQT